VGLLTEGGGRTILNWIAWSAIHIAIRRLSRKGCGCVLTY
jgi:hypothetical protein